MKIDKQKMEELFESFGDNFQEYIANYDGEGFSASELNITEEETEMLSLVFLLKFLNGGKFPEEDDEIEISKGIGSSFDGIVLSEVLGRIREDKKDDKNP